MKKLAIILIPFILFLSNNMISGQSYKPLLTGGNQWNVLTIEENWLSSGEYTWFTNKLSIGETVTIDNKIYHEIVNEEDSVFYLIHEDVEERKVFFDDVLVYDFSLSVGDSSNFYNLWGEYQYSLKVDSISDFTLNDGSIVKEFHNSCTDNPIDREYYPCINWIEGIGGNKGIYTKSNLFIVGVPYEYKLLCFKNEDELLYMDNDYSTCDETYTQIDIIDLSSISIFPNPSHLKINLDSPDLAIFNKINITDILGNTVKTSYLKSNPLESIDVSMLPSGIYFLQAENIKQNTIHHIGKFIKE